MQNIQKTVSLFPFREDTGASADDTGVTALRHRPLAAKRDSAGGAYPMSWDSKMQQGLDLGRLGAYSELLHLGLESVAEHVNAALPEESLLVVHRRQK